MTKPKRKPWNVGKIGDTSVKEAMGKGYRGRGSFGGKDAGKMTPQEFNAESTKRYNAQVGSMGRPLEKPKTPEQMQQHMKDVDNKKLIAEFEAERDKNILRSQWELDQLKAGAQPTVTGAQGANNEPTGTPTDTIIPEGGQQSLTQRDAEFKTQYEAKLAGIAAVDPNTGRNYDVSVTAAKSTFAQLLDVFTLGPLTKITKKYGSKTGAIEDNFETASKIIDSQMADLKNGIGSIEETEYQMQKIQSFISQMDAISKGEGQYDIQYWKDFGLSTHEQANFMTEKLNSYQRELQALKDARELSQTRTRLGLGG